jgi:hypothetical protein
MSDATSQEYGDMDAEATEEWIRVKSDKIPVVELFWFG